MIYSAFPRAILNNFLKISPNQILVITQLWILQKSYDKHCRPYYCLKKVADFENQRGVDGRFRLRRHAVYKALNLNNKGFVIEAQSKTRLMDYGDVDTYQKPRFISIHWNGLKIFIFYYTCVGMCTKSEMLSFLMFSDTIVYLKYI